MQISGVLILSDKDFRPAENPAFPVDLMDDVRQLVAMMDVVIWRGNVVKNKYGPCSIAASKTAPTPETNAFANEMYSSGTDCHADGRRALELARKFERERNELKKIQAG